MTDAAKRRLLDRLRPETARTGHVERLLATTHDLDAEFFDTDFLCTALAVSRADYAEHSGQLALQRKLAELEYCGVLCEAGAYKQRPTLRTVVHPVRVRGGRLHAKLVVVQYQHAVRILVGSANLTMAGYRHNREVCGEHLAYADEPEAAATALAMLRDAVPVLEPFADRAQEFLAELQSVLQRLATWSGGTAIPQSPVLWSDGERTLSERFLAQWRAGERVRRLRVVSPFWSEDGSRDTPLRRLLGALRERDALEPTCDVELFLDSVARADGVFVPKDAPRVYFSDFPGVTVRAVPVNPEVDSSDLDVKADLTAARQLHAKVVVLESADRALAYAGSGNFTRRGWGLGHNGTANVEAGWVFDVAPREVASLLPPVAGSGEVLTSLEAPLVGPSDAAAEDVAAFWPESLLRADLVEKEGRETELELQLTWDATTPAGWRVTTWREEGDGEGERLAETREGAHETRAPLTPAQLRGVLRDRHVLVVAGEERAAFPVNVAAGEARALLPLAPAGSRPGEQQLLDYYQGRITLDDLYPARGGEDASGDDEGPLHERDASGVDKMRIQSYQIRAFVDALPGLRRELLEARGTRGALFQAFLGEVSPLALAKQIVAEARSGRRSVTAAAFQLVELAAVITSVAGDVGDAVPHFQELCDRALREIQRDADALMVEHAAELGKGSAFERYRVRLQGDAL